MATHNLLTDPLCWGNTLPWTLAGDTHADWQRTPNGYRHAGCPDQVYFHWHERDPYQAPRLAVCGGCGETWTRRHTGATHKHANTWRKENPR